MSNSPLHSIWSASPHPIETRRPGWSSSPTETYLIADGMKPRRLDVAASRLTDEDREREFREEPSGGTDIERRIADQERDGVVAEVIYPNNLFLFASPDPAYQMAVAKAYSDWALEIFAARPDRFAPVAIIPAADILAAVSEGGAGCEVGFPNCHPTNHHARSALQSTPSMNRYGPRSIVRNWFSAFTHSAQAGTHIRMIGDVRRASEVDSLT